MFKRPILTLLSLFLLSGCGNLSKVSGRGDTDNPIWPSVEKSTFNHNGSQFGSWPNRNNIHLIEKGMNKDQIYNLIGRPHFSEGIARVREWDYVFNFRDHGEHHICQFKILFDKNMNVGSVYWLPESCKLRGKDDKQEVAVRNTTTHKKEIKADLLFSFDSAEVEKSGREYIASLSKEIVSHHYDKIVISGYTDNIGSHDYNMILSGKRANAVKDILIQYGIPYESIITIARGSSEPVVFCKQKNRAQLQECLQPNRRTVLTVL